MPKEAAWLAVSDGGAVESRFVDCPRGIVAFMRCCSTLSSRFAVGRRSRSERDGLEGMVPEKEGEEGMGAGEGALRTSICAAVQSELGTSKSR